MKKRYLYTSFVTSFVCSVLFMSLLMPMIYFFETNEIFNKNQKIFEHTISKNIDLIKSKNWDNILQIFVEITQIEKITIFDSNCKIILSTDLKANKSCKKINKSCLHYLDTISGNFIIHTASEYNFNVFFNKYSFVFFIVFCIQLFFLNILIYFINQKFILRPINNFISSLTNLNIHSINFETNYEIFNNLKDSIQNYLIKINKLEQKEFKFNLTRSFVHDIRTPLENLEYFFNNTKNLTEEQKNILEKTILKFKDISNKLLIDSKSSPPTRFKNIHETIKNTIEIFQNRLKEKNIEFIIDLDPKVQFTFDSNLLEITLENLIRNSLEADSTKITIHLKENALHIIDNGQGMNEEQKARLFKEEFTTKPQGNGIGLYSLKKTLNENFADIELVESIAHQRTHFKIIFNQLNNKLLALIDNDPFVRESWEYFGKKSNYQIKTFSNLDEFILANFPKHINVYIDSQLDNNLKGEVESKKLYEAGYNNLYLASGLDDIDLKNYPWLKGSVGKKFPFNS